MKKHNHKLTFDDKKGLMVLFRRTNDVPAAQLTPFNEILAQLTVRIETPAGATADNAASSSSSSSSTSTSAAATASVGAVGGSERWLLDSYSYTTRGLERRYELTFTPAQYVARLAKWTQRGWPVGLLRTDPLACKAFEDNCLYVSSS